MARRAKGWALEPAPQRLRDSEGGSRSAWRPTTKTASELSLKHEVRPLWMGAYSAISVCRMVSAVLGVRTSVRIVLIWLGAS